MINKIFNCYKLIKTRGLLVTLNAITRIIYFTIKGFFINSKLILVNIYNFKMFLSLKDKGLSRSLLLFSNRELDHKYLLEKIVKKNSLILDIGANIGYYALIEKNLVEDSSNILCIEPIPENYLILNKNLNFNYSKSKTLEGAVSNEDVDKEINLAHHSNLSSFHYNESKNKIYTSNKVLVKTYSIETIVNNYILPTIIRMDVEGHEVEIFENIIKVHDTNNLFRPTIIFETHYWRYQEDNCFANYLKDLQFRGYIAKYISSSDKKGSEIIEEKKYLPIKEMNTDGVTRKIYNNINFEDLSYFLFNKGGVRTVVISFEK